ncbi:MAG: DNA polymerase III subunit delta [Chlamydiota bacterium]
MKFTTLAELNKHLSQNSLLPIYLVVSKENLDLQEARHTIMKNNFPDATQLSFQGDDLSPSQLSTEMDSYSFFESRKLIIIDSAEKISGEIAEMIKNFLTAPAPMTTILLLGNGKPRSTSLVKAIEKKGALIQFPDLKPWEQKNALIAWVQEEVLHQHKKIDAATSKLLIEDLGLNKGLIKQELEKLYCYLGERSTVTLKDIKAICATVPTETVWKWRDAILEGRPGEALRIGRILLESNSIQALLANLRSQMQTAYQICSTIESGGSPQDVTALFPYMKGQILNKNIQVTRRYGSRRFQAALIAINETETSSKNKSTAPEILLELLLTKITPHNNA